MRAIDPLSAESLETIADKGRLESVARHVRATLVAALMECVWPNGDIQRWRDQCCSARLAAARFEEMLQRPRQSADVNLRFEYRAALMQIRNFHVLVLAPDFASPEVTEPLPRPEVCPVRLRQALDVSCDLAMLLTMSPLGDC
jgi:hypothetical protein